ncbi:MAG: hypothetical protein PHY41_07740 [Candidatus Cloacimonetes bacterium]|nr:hypothetical protein [Candidatus Cloacimonadota bacterium]
MSKHKNQIYNDDANIFGSNKKSNGKRTVFYTDKKSKQNIKSKQRYNFIFPIFALLDILMIMTAGLSGYGGWAAMAFMIIFPGLLVIGVILAVILDKNYDEKVTAIFGKTGYYILPAIYVCIILFGVFFVGDNGDGEGSGSMFSVILGGSRSFSYNAVSIIPNIFYILLLAILLSIATYNSKKQAVTK